MSEDSIGRRVLFFFFLPKAHCRLNMEPEPCWQTKTTDEQRLKKYKGTKYFLRSSSKKKKRKEKSIFSMHLDSFGVHRQKDIKRRKNCLGMLPFFLEFQLELVCVCHCHSVSLVSCSVITASHSRCFGTQP